jgi:ABC-type cobalamin/Fe3+-siderophores transport system ATPase subunit
VALLKDGAFLALGAPEQAITEASLRALYGVDVRIAERAEDGRTRRVCLPRRAA